jgi:hypothetical protein
MCPVQTVTYVSGRSLESATCNTRKSEERLVLGQALVCEKKTRTSRLPITES